MRCFAIQEENTMQRMDTKEPRPFEKVGIEAVRKAAPECMVLLKNEKNILPLSKPKEIALYGSGVRHTVKGGTGSGDVNVRHFVTVEEGIENAGIKVASKAWLDEYDKVCDAETKAFFERAYEKALENHETLFDSLVWLTAPQPEYDIAFDVKTDTAIYVLSRISGEGKDRSVESGDIALSHSEIRDILELNKRYQKFVLVLNVGGVVDLTPVLEVDTILLMSQVGIASGDALCDVLFGKVYPSGKLTTTWAEINDYPSTKGFGARDDTYYHEGIYVGYRYFDTVGYQPMFPFGYGLSYTKFEIAESKVVTENGVLKDNSEITVEAVIKNIGKFPGKEVVQVYICAPQTELDKPYQELKGYRKTKELLPNATEKVSIQIPIESLASFDSRLNAYVLEAGNYEVRIGFSSRDTKVVVKLTLAEDIVLKKVKTICENKNLTDTFSDFTPKFVGLQNQKVVAKSIEWKVKKSSPIEVKYSEEAVEYPKTGKYSWEDVTSKRISIDSFVAGLTNEELAHICVGNFDETTGDSIVGDASAKVAGAAGETTHFNRKYGIPEAVMADGPAGLRLSPIYNLKSDGCVRSKGSSFDNACMKVLTEEQLKKLGWNSESDTDENVDASVDYYQYATAIPIGTALAQSWNDQLAYELGDLVGSEMEIFGIDLWLAPALNIHRSVLCGRNFEYYSEDPLISGKMAAAITRGVQSHRRKAVTIKHFAANNQETNRNASNSVVSERALREIYLKGFEICVREASPKAVMSSYNLVNGEHTCQIKDLQTYVLRDEWGFDGFVMTDWSVTKGLTKGDKKYPVAYASGIVKAGNDMTMPGNRNDIMDILKALEDQRHPYSITRAQLQLSAKRILSTILSMCI